MKSKLIFIGLLLTISGKVSSQVNPLSSLYFQNRYPNNPALINDYGRINLNAALKSATTGVEGAPITQAISIDYGASDNVGIGFSILNEKAGLISRLRAMGSYSYRFNLSTESDFLSFGMALGIFDENFDAEKVRGHSNDATVASFIKRPMYFDGDLGITYKNELMTIQASLPNLKHIFISDKRNTINNSMYTASIQYKIKFQDLGRVFDYIEPIVSYRGIKNMHGILDVGGTLNSEDSKLIVYAMYHSSKSATIGLGTVFPNNFGISCYYVTNTSTLQSYTNSEFEIALKYSLFKKN